MNVRALSLMLALGLGTVVTACGPKDEVENIYNEDGSINPKRGFAEAVRLLRTPDKKTNEIDYATAYKYFSESADAAPTMANAHYNAGWAAEQLGDNAAAQKHYRNAYEQQPTNTEFLFAYTDLLTRNDKGAEAADLFSGYLETHADDLDVRNAYSEALTVSGRHDDAIEQSQEVLLRDAKNVAAYRNLSRAYFAKGEYAMSQLCAEKAKTMAEGDAGIYNNIGVTFLVMDDEPAAIEEFKTARKLDPDNLEANLNLGYVALNSGDYILAKECFEKALENTPGSVDARLGLAVALRGVKEYDRAAELYDQILKSDPNNEMAYFNASSLHSRYTKDYKQARKYLNDFIENNNADGSIGPSHVVYERIAEIDELEEEQRKIEEEKKRIEQERIEREKRQKEEFDRLKSRFSAFQADLESLADCEYATEMGVQDMGMMVVEQAMAVIEMEDVSMAGDVMMFFDELEPQIAEIKPICAEAAAAPAPEEGGAGDGAEGGDEGGEAPPEGGEEAPAEEGTEEPAPE
ncbi:MAG: tetratricopeptide repeat protein [Myxococcota bacterium]